MSKTIDRPLHKHVLCQKRQIVDRWVTLMKREIPVASRLERPALIDSLPDFLDRLAEALIPDYEGVTASQTNLTPVSHGIQRAETGRFTLDQLLQEYVYLNAAILDVLNESIPEGLSAEHVKRINDSVMDAMREAACSFVNRIEEQRDETEAMYRRLVHETRDVAIFMISRDGVILTWNEGAERIKGFSADDTIGHYYGMLYRPEDQQEGRPKHNIEAALKNGRHEEQWWRMKKDGTAFWADVIISPVHSPDGILLGLSKFVRDLTEKMYADQALRTAKEQAEMASQMKSTFVANMSHEIRTPLGAILGFAEILKDADSTYEDRQQASNIIEKNGKVLTRLIDDILDLSKIEAGKLEIQIINIPMIQTLTEVTSYFELRAREKGIGLELIFGKNIPEYVCSDPVRLRQILNNLIGNAVKFTDKGGVEVRVEYLPLDSGGKVEVVVKDTGHGIPYDQRDKLFQLFSQADNSSTRRFGGTGLGLALSRRLARELGGDVELVNCPPNKGCIFKVTISDFCATEESPSKRPIAQPGKAEFARAKEPPLLANRPHLARKRILLVEDSPDNQVLMQKLLKRVGVDVSIACNGAEGVDMALQGNFDLVLMDMQMPVLDGNSATQKLRAMGFHTPIVALTAHAMRNEQEKSIRSGCNDYLTKPIDTERLKEVLTKHLRSHEDTDQPIPLA